MNHDWLHILSISDGKRRRITADEYDKYYKAVGIKIVEIDTKLSRIGKAGDNYYLASEYILKLLSNSYDLFISSEIEQKRQLLKLILHNSELDGRLVKYSLLKPFDAILNDKDNVEMLRD